MSSPPQSLRTENERLSAELEELRVRLEDAEQALEAIRTGQAESLIVEGPDGPRIFSLEGADHAYRVLVEAMNEGAATLGEDGTVLYCNTRFAQMLAAPLERVMGSTIFQFLPRRSREPFEAMVREANGGESRGELELLAQGDQLVPAYLSVSIIHDDSRRRLCLVAADLRAQKRSEEIVGAERLARSVLNQAAEAIVVCDENGRIVRASDSAAELSEMSLLLARFEEALPLTLSESDPHEPELSVIARALRGEVLRAVPASLARPDGSKAELLVSAKALHGTEERVIGCVVSIVDVTEHRRSEEALRASHAQLRMAIAASRMVAWSWDAGADRIAISDGFEALYGRPPVTSLEEAHAMIHPEDRARHLSTVEATMRAGGRYESEFRVRHHRTGELLWIHQRAEVHKDEIGRLRRLVGVDMDVTERKQAELELARAKDQLELTLDSITDGYYALDAEWRFVAANRVAEEHFGAAEEDLQGRDLRELSGSRLDPGVRRRLQQARASGEPVHFEAESPVRPGSWAEMHVYPREDGVLDVYYRDITERKQAERALQLSEERLRLALEGAQQGIWDWDLKTKGLVWDARCKRVFGLTEDAPIGFESFMARVHPEDRPRLMHELDLAVLDARDTQFEYRVIRPDGAIRWIHAPSKVFSDEHGRPYRMSGTVLDITERKLAEEKLRDSEERLWIAKSAAGLGILDFDVASGTTEWDERVRELWGVTLDEPVTYEAFLAGLHPEDREQAQVALDRALDPRASGEYRAELRVVGRADRRERWIAATGRVAFDQDRPVRLVATLQDVTQRKAIEEALRDADRRKNRFLAVLSHELRNPLAPIKNSLFILDRAAPGGDQARRAQAVIDRQSGQLARLVDDLLDVTRITSDKIQLQRQRLELNELVRRTIDDYRDQFEKAEVSLELVPAPRPVYVDADWNRLAQVIGNLLQNAVKFTGRGGQTRVSVSADAARRRAAVRVRDTGAGLAPEMMERLFEPFSQADETLDRSKGGLGLGLALVRGLVELHGGEVSVQSDGLGKGAEFTVELPLDIEAVAEAAAPRAGSERGRWRVLIIEDNIDAADSLCEALELSEHEVAVAYNGADGLEKARSFHPEVVLCDIGLPGMDGYEVARAFRADDVLRGTHLVALSGYAQPEDLRRASEAGFERHLAKPPNIEKLEEVLASVAAS